MMKKDKRVLKVLIVLSIMSMTLLVSFSAHAEGRKGVLIKWWERIVARIGGKKVSVPEEKKPVAEEKPEEIVRQEISVEEIVTEEMPAEEEAEEAVPVEAKKAAEMVERPEEEVGEEVPEKILEKAPEKIPEKAPEKIPEKAAREEPQPPPREIPLTREKMVEVIERRLEVYSQIVYIIPGLSFETTEEGKKEYYYETMEGDVISLSDLDKETLYNLYGRVNNEATRIHTERLLRQIQQQEQLIRSIPRQPQQPPAQPPQPPQIYTPPQQPPQPPSPPPQPPQTHRR